jgi:hypothetical protein
MPMVGSSLLEESVVSRLHAVASAMIASTAAVAAVERGRASFMAVLS